MASNMQPFPRILKMLRENSNIKEKREALSYIRSNSRKLEFIKAIKEEQYRELCKLVVDAFTNENSDMQNEAYETLNVIIKEFKDHTLNLFEAISRISQKNRLKILKLLEVVEDNAISKIANDTYAVNFFYNCMCTVQTNIMPWIAPTACVDNLQALTDAESKPLSDDQRLEEETINYCITLLRRLYKVAAMTTDTKIQRFNALLLDKVILLAYMGHKRQRGPALKLLQQALATSCSHLSDVRNTLANAWAQYLTALQSTYYKRMLLLVSASEIDWAIQWNISIQLLGVDLHRGATLINNLLSVEEKAFKSTDTITRRQAFLSWKLLVDNFALDPYELASARRIKLLCIPLNAKNSKTELIALTKLEVWWHVIIKLYKDIYKFVNPVITQFLNFCFGPLGDTPLLSSKFDVVASPGKRFFKTKLIAVDALCQLLVTKQENHTAFSPVLEERLPCSISDAIFQQCYKSIIHSVGEALLVLSQLTDAELKNRYQLGKMLWTSLVNYVQESKMKEKGIMYKDMIIVITELAGYAGNKPMVKNLILDTILFGITDMSENFNFKDDLLSKLVFKLVQMSIFKEAEKKHYVALKRLFWYCIKSQKENTYYSHAFNCLKEMYEKLKVLLNAGGKNKSVIFQLWLILADALGKYMSDIQEINEGSNTTEHNLKTVESIVTFPFTNLSLEDQDQVLELTIAWKDLYKQFEMRADLITSVRSNEILLNIATVMQRCLTINERSSYVTIHCLDILLNTINYNLLLANTEVPSIVRLIADLVVYFFLNKKCTECEIALTALSSVIVTVSELNPEKIVPYLQVCKPAIEIMLQSEIETLYKQIVNTWKAVISIFKNLGKLLDYDLFLSFKKLIILALNHSNPSIQYQTVPVFELKNVLNDRTKVILQEIETEAGKDKTLCKSENDKDDQIEELSDSANMVGNFLKGFGSINSTVKENNESNKALIDSDSQDYVFIKTDLKFDVNHLTEHQKESFKRRREDIPALYNDLTQSSSQDTQNLQEWFDKKSKILEETEKIHNTKDNTSMENVLDDDANKENKIEVELEINKSIVENDTKLTENVGQNVSTESVHKVKGNVDNNEKLLTENQTIDKAYDIEETLTDSVSKNLNSSDVPEEALENKDDQRLSPSVLDNGKRRNRSSIAIKSNVSQKPEEINNQPGQSNGTQILQRTLRTKVIQCKPETIDKQKVMDSIEHKSIKEDKKGIKRKSTLEIENDGVSLRQRRKTISVDINSDTDSCKSTENDNALLNLEEIIDDSNLSQRTRNEISRLRINMVFDSPLSTSRRSKGYDDKEFITKKQLSENKKVAECMKRSKKINNKELKEDYRGKGKLSKMKKIEKNVKVRKIENINTSLQDNNSELVALQTVEEKEREKTIEAKVILESISSHETQRTDVNENVQSIEKKRQTDITYLEEIEDIIEDSQELSRLQQRLRRLEQKIENSRTEDAKEVSQSKTKIVEGETETEKRNNEENVQTEVISKITLNDKCVNTEITNNDNSNSELHDATPIQEKSQVQNDMEDIIESSQGVLELGKNCSEKQCFIKINKIENVSPSMKCYEINVGDEQVTTIVSNECDDDNNEVPNDNVKEFEKNNEVNVTEPKNLIPENKACDSEKDASETQKINDGSAVKSLLEFTSPKSNIKRQTKFKPYSGQGRAAHMLGLVTKQARMEAESVVSLDDEPPVKKVKCKDTENDVLLGKKEQGLLMKEVDKVTAASSSRQEKIFSNMRSADYCSSPPIKLFSNLKNDGEKIFSKTEKLIDCTSVQTDAQSDKVGEETLLEADELPILEWSSANPPSLTASPSASILKRQRNSIPEPDPEAVTPNKRKRVSFADPPVSKEMGYEIASVDSHKANKFTSRGVLVRKDSPLRLKQIKQKSVSIDSDKMEKDEENNLANASEVDLQCERENELLTKIAEEMEYSENIIIDTDAHASYSCMEDESSSTIPVLNSTCNKIETNNLNVEFEDTQDLNVPKYIKLPSINKGDQNKKGEILETSRSSNVSLESTKLNDSGTQEDIFTEIDTQHNDYVKDIEVNSDSDTGIAKNVPTTNSSLDSFNVVNESIIEHSLEKHMNSENLEDTVDAANLTELNFSASSDEIFCGKLVRTSTTQGTENMQEQDTLPVTDSVFGSLPLSQESQNTNEFNAEVLNPELLDSVHPIYPTLILCKEPVTAIIDHLTNPLWIKSLFGYLTSRNVLTVGDFARLSEREVNRIPVKGNSKIEFVKSVLKSFEKKNAIKEIGNAIDLNGVLNNEISCSVNINEPASTLRATQDQALKTTTDKIQNKFTNDSMQSYQFSSSNSVDNIVVDKNVSETFKQTIVSPSNDVLNVFTASAPTSLVQSTNVNTTQTIDVLPVGITATIPDIIIVNPASVVRTTTPIIQGVKSIAACTNSNTVYFSKPVTTKATKSVEIQMRLEDLLDEIDVNLVLQSAARRCTPEKLLMQYKNKMRHVSQVELESETIKLLGNENRKNSNEVALKAACRACGVNKVLLRLPDIFCADKQFFVKVLSAYKQKIKTSDCLDILDYNEVKESIWQRCTSSELAEMLSNKLKEEEKRGIRKVMTELSSLDAMLKRMPMDEIISHTVANDELIPSPVVLDIALQNNSPTDIALALESQSSIVTKNVFDKLWSSQFAVEHIDECNLSKDELLKLFKAVSLKLSHQDLLQAFYEAMNVKLIVKQERN